MSDDAVEYLTLNVGLPTTETFDATAYVYVNVGNFGIASVVGRVVGLTFERNAAGYVHLNVTE